MIFGTSRKVFVGLGQKEVCVHLRGPGRKENSDKAFAAGSGDEVLSPESLATVLESAAGWIQQTLGSSKPVEVHWAISDPWVHQRVFPVDRLPRGNKATQELVQWRFGQDLGSSPETLKVAWQLRSAAREPAVLHGIGIENELYELLCQPWLKRRWPVTSMVTLLNGLEVTQDWITLDKAPLTVALTDEYWLTSRPGASGLRCRWFTDDPDCESLLRDIARGVNEEGRERIVVYGSDAAPGVCERIKSRFAGALTSDGLAFVDLYRGQDSRYEGLSSGLRSWAEGRAS